jgi:hypothetical protein
MDADQRLWIMWASLASSVLLYAGLALGIEPAAPPALAGGALLPALSLAAAGLGAGSVALRARLLAAPARAGSLDVTREPGATRFQVVSIVCFALSEAVALLGLVGFLLGGSRPTAICFAAAGAVLLVFHAPRRSALLPPAGSQDLPHRPDPIG